MTVLLSALRAGASVDEVRALCPGIDPRAMLEVHSELADRVADALEAWDSICASPTDATLRVELVRVAPVLTVPAVLLATHLVAGGHDIADLVLTVARRVADQRDTADMLFGRLAVCPDRSIAGIEAGARLYHPLRDCVIGDPFFLPERVGELHPRHLALLLGERAVPAMLAELADPSA